MLFSNQIRLIAPTSIIILKLPVKESVNFMLGSQFWFIKTTIKAVQKGPAAASKIVATSNYGSGLKSELISTLITERVIHVKHFEFIAYRLMKPSPVPISLHKPWAKR
jgi:hypothetical protein